MESSLLKIAANIASENRQAKKRPKKKVSKKPNKRRTQKTSRPTMDGISYEDMTIPQTEYSAMMELSLSVNFEGSADKGALMTKMKQELLASIETGVSVTARAFNLKVSNLKVKPLKVNMVVNDVASLDEDIF